MSRRGEPLLLLVLAIACASNPRTPDGWLPDREEAARDPYGGWAVVEGGGRRTTGELIAVDGDSLFVLGENGGLVGRERARIRRVVVVKYRPPTLWPWALLGGLSTISNGYLLIFTAPMWAIGGPLTIRAENRASRVEIPPGAWEDAAPHARFPQGLPRGLDRSTLVPRPR